VDSPNWKKRRQGGVGMHKRRHNDNEKPVGFTVKKPNKYLTLALSVAMVLVLGATDFISGYEISFSIFYLIPISFMVYISDFRFGLVISVLSAASWLLADINGGHNYQSLLIPAWNATMRLIYFILHSFLLSKFLNAYKIMRVKAVTDSLTHAVNAQFFYELSVHELKRAERTKKPMTLAYVDMDNFKSINDTYGHLTGDSLLRIVSRVIKENIRPSDIFGRLGGDEFALLFPETDYDTSAPILARIREKINGEMARRQWPVTMSAGAITFMKADLELNEMIKRVDDLMYRVKNTGKNNIEHTIAE
jgi:diguanylate cyclase (GGDEF)-like protein